MVKFLSRCILLGALGWLIFLFYKTYIADTVEPFFMNNAGKVDYFGLETADKKLEAIEESQK